MEDLVFPWKGAPGVTMVGYGATPDIDAYFLSATADQLLDWRNEAGIHPDTNVLGTPGDLLTGIAGLLASIFLEAYSVCRNRAQENERRKFCCKLTLWEPRSDLIDSVSSFIGGDAIEVALALDKLIVTPEDTRYFAASERPYIPLLIQISNVHVLDKSQASFGIHYTARG